MHSARTECPRCGKRLTVRTLRWKHLCKSVVLPRRLLDLERAAARREELGALALANLQMRLQQRNVGAARSDGGADQEPMG